VLLWLAASAAQAGIWGPTGNRAAFVSSGDFTNDVALTLDALKVGAVTYSNVTVTARTSTDLFIRHRRGIANFKLSELSTEALEQLGYLAPKPTAAPAEAKAAPTVAIPPGVNKVISQAKTNQVLAQLTRQILARITAVTRKGSPGGADAGSTTSTNADGTVEVTTGDGGPSPEGARDAAAALTVPTWAELKGELPQWAVVALSVMLVSFPIAYFFFCYTGGLICRKAGSKPGFLIWVPLLSLIPLTRAARLPGWMAALFIVPFLNMLFVIVWTVRLANARNKGLGTALCLLFPPTSLFAWLYLAYSR
jgi:hypothetical protein